MSDAKVIAIFRLNDGGTEHTLYDDMTYRCNHWPEGHRSLFAIEYGILFICHKRELHPKYPPKKESWDVWLDCPDGEMDSYKLLRERFELELAVHGLLIDKNMLE